jgi:hypothetical protein
MVGTKGREEEGEVCVAFLYGELVKKGLSRTRAGTGGFRRSLPSAADGCQIFFTVQDHGQPFIYGLGAVRQRHQRARSTASGCGPIDSGRRIGKGELEGGGREGEKAPRCCHAWETLTEPRREARPMAWPHARRSAICGGQWQTPMPPCLGPAMAGSCRRRMGYRATHTLGACAFL